MDTTRRQAVRVLLAGGAALYLQPWMVGCSSSQLRNRSVVREKQRHFSPIDRTLADIAPRKFFADNPDRSHAVLWDKHVFLKSNGLVIPPPTQEVPLIIIGGGIAGLFSAYLLREHQPVILEQDSHFGGNSKGQSWRDIDYSIGAAYFIEPEGGSDIDTLLRELEIDKLWTIKEEEDPVAVNGSIYKGFWTGESLAGDPAGLAQIEKLSQYFSAVNEGEEIAFPDIPITDPDSVSYIHDLDSLSFRAHLESIVGGKLHAQIDTAIEQYCWSSLGASASELSAAGGVNFYASEFGKIAVLPGGNAAVAERVLERLGEHLPQENLRPSSLVFDVQVTESGVQVAYLDASGAVQCIAAKAVVMACPKFIAAKILRDIEPERVAAIQKLKYRSYLVANLCLGETSLDPFYDLYVLGDGKIDSQNPMAASKEQKVTDVVLANYARAGASDTVLSLYRGLPYDGARGELYVPGAYDRYRAEFEQQILGSILPALQLKPEQIVDLRIARWGHPLVVSAPGLIKGGTIDQLRKPFKHRVFFVEQDNWALPAFETSVTEAMYWAPQVKQALA